MIPSSEYARYRRQDLRNRALGYVIGIVVGGLFFLGVAALAHLLYTVILGNPNILRSEDGNLSICNTEFYPWIDATDGDWQLISAAPDLLAALKILHDETADYIKINNLGDPHHNKSMQYARDAIAKAEG